MVASSTDGRNVKSKFWFMRPQTFLHMGFKMRCMWKDMVMMGLYVGFQFLSRTRHRARNHSGSKRDTWSCMTDLDSQSDACYSFRYLDVCLRPEQCLLEYKIGRRRQIATCRTKGSKALPLFASFDWLLAIEFSNVVGLLEIVSCYLLATS